MSDVLNNVDHEAHHFSFMQLGTQEGTVKAFSYNRLLEALADPEVVKPDDVNDELEKEENVEKNTEKEKELEKELKKEIKEGKINAKEVRQVMSVEEENLIMMRNILIFTPIGLAVIVLFAVYLMMYMEIPKSTILYATYVTNKSG